MTQITLNDVLDLVNDYAEARVTYALKAPGEGRHFDEIMSKEYRKIIDIVYTLTDPVNCL